METFITWFIDDYLIGLVQSIVSTEKRVSIFYLFSAIVVALFWAFSVEKSPTWRDTVRKLFSRQIWFSKSSFIDLKMVLINRAIMIILAPLMLSKIALTTAIFFTLSDYFSNIHGLLSGTPQWLAPVTYTIFLFIFDDLSRFITHRMLHKIPILWEIHKAHHSAEYLTPFTVFRTHPIEGIIFSTRSIIVQSVSVSLFIFLFGDKIDLVSIYGVNFLIFIFNITGANLRHSHINISYGRFFEKIFISPLQHQIHHSTDPTHFNKNFGVALAIWDFIGNTLMLSNKNVDNNLRFGLGNNSSLDTQNLIYIYFHPFLEIHKQTKRLLKSIVKRYNILLNKIRFQTRTISLSIFIITIGVTGIFATTHLNAEQLNLYSHRQPFLMKPFLSAFEKETGVKTNVVYASKGLAQRLLAEGKRSPADVILTVDISRLNVYSDKNLLARVDSKILEKNIPPHIRDKNNYWFGFSKRARIVAISTKRVKLNEIIRIEDLAEPRWKGRVCSRPGSHVYNRALLSSIIAANGETKAEIWANGLVKNLAQRPQGNDRAQVKAISQGVCDIAIINSYYFGKLRNSQILDQREWVKNIKIVFTNQNDRGNHINISGGGVAKYSKNKVLAIRFLEFLSQDKAQRLYSQINYEFPANPNVKFSKELLSWGSFSEDKLPITKIAELSGKAQRIIDRVGW
jgi:iron(III) transport system substrate-binding protein